MAKIDLKKDLKSLYHVTDDKVVEVQVPPLKYLMVDGEGDPNTVPEYAQAVEALFTVSYKTKFALKKSPAAIDYAVMPLEGLWWADDMSSFAIGDKTKWRWTMMILQPDFVRPDLITTVMADLAKNKKLPALEKLRFETLCEGRCAQILHVGPFSEEGPSIAKVHDFIAGRGRLTGKHHEIYLSDVRRAAPARWKTILRQPMS